MIEPNRDSQAAHDSQDDSLELNKETLGELDVEPSVGDAVKGGALPKTTVICYVSTPKASAGGGAIG